MAASTGRTGADRELDAIGSILRALDGLEGESIQRVLDYVFGRLSIVTPARSKPAPTSPIVSPPSHSPDLRARRRSIRDLKDEKQPESANQMAALVAFYLSEEAEDENRKEAIGTPDLERYFKQAGFRLPRTLSQTLANAAAAGYFDPVGNGLYKLNAVGYNLVVHGLPRPHKVNGRSSGRSRKKSPAKRRTS
jgi:hypothetical protein